MKSSQYLSFQVMFCLYAFMLFDILNVVNNVFIVRWCVPSMLTLPLLFGGQQWNE